MNILTDYATVVDSLHETPEYVNEGYPMVRVADINNFFLNLENCLKVDKTTMEIHNKNYTPQKGDVIITRVGSYGMTAYVNTNELFCLGQNIAIIHPLNETLGKFIYYYIKSPYMQKQIYGNIGGSSYKCISLVDIKNFPMTIKDIDIYNISKTLFAFDSKIENNNKINTTLESLAKVIYDYWFLQYEFPNKEGKPYKSSGGKMVWSDELKQEIPEGWEVKALKDLTTLDLGGTPNTESESYWNGNINWLNSGEISQFPVISSELKITNIGVENSATKPMKKGTIVISITGNIRASILAIDSCANQSVVGIRETKLLKKSFLYPTMNHFLEYYTSISTGNCQKHINKNTLESTKIAIPPNNVLDQYYEYTENLYDYILVKAEESAKLVSLRDFLLPLLMNGQVGFKIN